MCGILLTTDPRYSPGRFQAALDLLHHRGPDATGYLQSGATQIGHKRLKIIDLDNRSNQPFLSRDGRYALIFNGEIYNFRELCARNTLPQLRTTSDTEVVLELYIKYGASFVTQLDGMFALAIVDMKTGAIFAARDRLGVKPMYMHRAAGHIVLCSELRPILELTGVSEVDPLGLRQYLKLRTFFNNRTIYRSIEMFPAGCYLHAERFTRYWEFEPSEQAPPADVELRQLVEESVAQRLIADVPIGSYLSGGLDSSIVATLSRQPHTWTVGFADHNEFEWARMVAAHISSDHHEVLITEREFVELTGEMLRTRREPLSVPNEVLLYKMTQEVKKVNTVVLSGEGADELFFGYDRIFRWAAEIDKWDLESFSRLYSYGSQPDLEVVEDAMQPFLKHRDPIAIVASFFQVAHLHGLLRRLDNATMQCSVEARVPFVDSTALIQRLAGVPLSYRMGGGVVKSPLKRVFRGVLPPSVVNREKVGFPVPLGNITFPGTKSEAPFDRWLEFNLQELFGGDECKQLLAMAE